MLCYKHFSFQPLDRPYMKRIQCLLLGTILRVSTLSLHDLTTMTRSPSSFPSIEQTASNQRLGVGMACEGGNRLGGSTGEVCATYSTGEVCDLQYCGSVCDLHVQYMWKWAVFNVVPTVRSCYWLC